MSHAYVTPKDVAPAARPARAVWAVVTALHVAGRLRLIWWDTHGSRSGSPYAVELLGTEPTGADAMATMASIVPFAALGYDEEAGLYDTRLGRR